MTNKNIRKSLAIGIPAAIALVVSALPQTNPLVRSWMDKGMYKAELRGMYEGTNGNKATNGLGINELENLCEEQGINVATIRDATQKYAEDYAVLFKDYKVL